MLNKVSIFKSSENGFIVSAMVKISVSKYFLYIFILFGFRSLDNLLFRSSSTVQTAAI